MNTQRTALLSLAIFGLFASVTVFAQKQGVAPQKPSSPTVSTQKTVVVCLTGYDALYLLEGDSALFKRYNARTVQITGSVSEPPPGTSSNNVLSQQPPTLTVSKLKKVADGCN